MPTNWFQNIPFFWGGHCECIREKIACCQGWNIKIRKGHKISEERGDIEERWLHPCSIFRGPGFAFTITNCFSESINRKSAIEAGGKREKARETKPKLKIRQMECLLN